jgi:hypothetical protein
MDGSHVVHLVSVNLGLLEYGGGLSARKFSQGLKGD